MEAGSPGILIVDDNDDDRYTLQLLLEAEGHTRITIATGGHEAIALLERERALGQLLADGSVQGVRIDHPDGLFDPKRYFEMLQDLARRGPG